MKCSPQVNVTSPQVTVSQGSRVSYSCALYLLGLFFWYIEVWTELTRLMMHAAINICTLGCILASCLKTAVNMVNAEYLFDLFCPACLLYYFTVGSVTSCLLCPLVPACVCKVFCTGSTNPSLPSARLSILLISSQLSSPPSLSLSSFVSLF